ncbi:MAG: tetratricopeptide repeat protein [Rhodocyclaceae bacterium]|nr:tetratricopeptide repeat protein [Rhodocyclaceae bacterium]
MPANPGRNDPCPCGSGKKYKKCCGAGPLAESAPVHAANLAQRMRAALEHHAAGRLGPARAGYQAILAFAPNVAEIRYLAERLAGVPPSSAQAAQHAAPDIARAINNLGMLHERRGEKDEATACYRRALELAPGLPEAANNLGNSLKAQGAMEGALACYEQACAAAPDFVTAHYNLAALLKSLNRNEQALAHFQKVLEIDPGHASARHAVDFMTGRTPERAPDRYVAELFDQYAGHFDAHLLQDLGYAVPDQFAAALARIRPEARRDLDGLDLGCGTGLAGKAVAGHCRTLVGVDLSANMLRQAAARNIYARLLQADVESAMAAESDASFDLVLAADLFIYIGRLDGIVAQARRLLRAGGLLLFSAEALELPGASSAPADPAGAPAPDYRLLDTGRYAHGLAYLQKLAGAAGFEVLETGAADARRQGGQAIKAWICAWRVPPAAAAAAP